MYESLVRKLNRRKCSRNIGKKGTKRNTEQDRDRERSKLVESV